MILSFIWILSLWYWYVNGPQSWSIKAFEKLVKGVDIHEYFYDNSNETWKPIVNLLCNNK